MSPVLTRHQLMALSTAKLEDAVLLSRDARWGNAYYIAGYSIELALKARIAKQFVAAAIPDKKLVLDIHTHDLPKLVSLAGLQSDLRARQDDDADFALNWALVSEWKPDSRYEMSDQTSAEQLIQAIADPAHGVFPWIQTFW